ncbi:MAG: ATP-binding protein [Anaerolineae bacterium]|nr:ATP-binding protein [Anaerolineae bacterium]
MSPDMSLSWHEANQRYLTAMLGRVRGILERRLGRDESLPEPDAYPVEGADHLEGVLPSFALDNLTSLFHLTPFERDVLLLCAGVELDSGFSPLIASVQGDPARAHPTFSLALSALPDAHWSALSPSGPLRYWRLIDLGPGSSVTQSPLRIDERILHFLAGITHLDERLNGYIAALLMLEQELVPSQAAIVDQIVEIWSTIAAWRALPPAIQLIGSDLTAQRAIAVAASSQLDLALHLMPTAALPASPVDMESLHRLWEREAMLSSDALLLDCDQADPGEAGRESSLGRWIESQRTWLIVSGRERVRTRRPLVTFEVSKPTTTEQRDLWNKALGSAAARLDGQIDAIVSQFSLDAATISLISAEVLRGQPDPDEPAEPEVLGATLWKACNDHSQPALSELAQRIVPLATWEDLVLPDAQMQILREISVHVRQRMKVYEAWGFAARSARGLGISALFSGASGTGKTMAAEVLANDLHLDLYRIDLSQVVSKYIGETEKNLRRVFDAAEEGGSILLFDEADALFGKRSEVKDSHDRYANVEISYLLQRMEAYRGLAILTTNLKEALDTAFLRRIRFAVSFPFPDAGQRAEIWRRIFPAQTPTNDLDISRLARLNIPGGNIHNIALYAAFLAADAGEPVRMSHLQRAAQVEFTKLERPLAETELGGRP